MSAREEFDVIVVGAGPAGLAACSAVSQYDLSVRLIDEQADAGGQIWRNGARIAGDPGTTLSDSYAGARDALHVLENPLVHHAPGATLLDARLEHDEADAPGVRATWLCSGPRAREMRETRARALILATGAMERPVLFPGASLPGVMGAGALQGILKQSGLVPGGPGVVLAGQGPLFLLTLTQILDHGGKVDAVLDLGQRRPGFADARALLAAWASDPKLLSKGAGLLRRARGSGVEWFRGVAGLRAHGGDGIEEIEFEIGGARRRLPCSLLGVHDGIIPNTQASRLLNLEHVWSDAQQAFAPLCDTHGRTGEPAVWVAGDGAGIAGVELAGARGRLAGIDVARWLEQLDGVRFEAAAAPLLKLIERRGPARTFIDRLYPPLPATALADRDPETLVCRCEAVTLAQVRAAIRDGATGPNRVKTFTRCGMGPCQGRMCGNALTRIVAAETGKTPQEAGALRMRPPLKPALIADYLDLDMPERTPE